jgi:hypothetical protein
MPPQNPTSTFALACDMQMKASKHSELPLERPYSVLSAAAAAATAAAAAAALFVTLV